MRATRSAAVATVAGFLTIAGVTGCNQIFNRLVDGVVRDEPITEVNIDGGGGDLTVITDSSVKGVDIRRTVEYLNRAPSTDDTIVFSGGRVTLKTDCGSQCSASYEVRTPSPGVKVSGDNGSGDIRLTDVSDVDIEVGSGDITVERASGSVKLETGSGDIELTDIGGVTSVSTGSGNVTGEDLRGATTEIQVSSGDINLHVPGTGDVRAVTSSGDIQVWVPERTTRFKFTSNSGDQNVNVAPDASSAHLLEVRTSSGNVTINPEF